MRGAAACAADAVFSRRVTGGVNMHLHLRLYLDGGKGAGGDAVCSRIARISRSFRALVVWRRWAFYL